MYLQHASGVSITLFIPIFWVNFTFRCQSCSHSGRTPFRPLFWKFNFSKIWTHMLLYLKTDCSYTNFSFLYVQTSSNIKKMRFYGLIWIIRPSKILLRLQEIAISCNLKQHTVESDLNEIWHSFYIPMRPRASYFHTLLIIEKGGGKGCAHDTCKVLMGSKMWENDKKIECIQNEHMGAPPFPPPFVQW